MVAGDGEKRETEAQQKRRGTLELIATPTMCEVTRRKQQLGLEARDELSQGNEWLRRLALADVEVGDVENVRGHRRGRLYTRTVANEAPELFDDIYLGLRAGGAVRKQRRGEPLSAEEKEAIGHWRRLSLWRKFIAVGAFALGTFGLGFTIGGLIFGRGRKARA